METEYTILQAAHATGAPLATVKPADRVPAAPATGALCGTTHCVSFRVP